MSAPLPDVGPVAANTVPWWMGGSLAVGANGLEVAGQSVAELAAEVDGPLYLYDGARVRVQIAEVRAALAPFRETRICYAMKANRFGPLLDLMRREGVDIDACSPREVAVARGAGFVAAQISVTASSLSEADLRAFAASGPHVNFDHAPTLRRYAQLVPRGTRVGLRIDPGVHVGYGVNSRTDYGDSRLGLSPADAGAALAAAQDAGLVVDTLHMHLGWGMRGKDEVNFRRALGVLADLAPRVPDLRCINVGGGLGGRLRPGDDPLRAERWAAAIGEVFGHGGPVIACELGTHLVAAAGILVAQVTATWTKNGERWAGLNVGQAANVYAAHYGLELEFVVIDRPLAMATERVSIGGNINESGDVFTRQRLLPPLAEGDRVAILPAGAYGSSMASDHCLRGGFIERLLP